MRNLKNILQSNIFSFAFFLCILGWCLFVFFVFPHQSKYTGDETQLVGKILTYHFDGDQLSMKLLAKEPVQVIYLLKTEEEKKELQENIGYHTEVKLIGTLQLPKENGIPNTFSYPTYLRTHHIYYLFEAKTLEVQEQGSLLYQIKTWIWKQAQQPCYSKYLRAFLFGEKEELDMELLQQNGISHLFAISGMHFSFLVAILLRITKFLKKNSFLVILFLLWVYAFFVGFSPSVLRAVLIYTLARLNLRFSLHLSKKRLYFLCVMIVLGLDPYFLFDLGFQYSFLISFFLLFLPTCLNRFLRMFEVCVFAFLASVSVTAMNTYEINFLAIVMNLILVPVVSLVLYPLVFFSFFLPFLTWIVDLLFFLFESFNTFMSSWHAFTFVIPKCSYVVWIIYDVLLFLCFKYPKRIWILGVYLELLHCSVFLDPNAHISFVDVGQGDCTIFISPHRKEVFLIDVGGTFQFQKEPWAQRKENHYVAKNIATYLHSLGIRKIQTLFLSHGDVDHAGNTLELLNHIEVEEIVFNSNQDTLIEQQIKEVAKEKIALHSSVRFFQIDQLNPYIYDSDENKASLVHLVRFWNYQILMMGDAPKEVEKTLFKKNLSPTFLKLGHHGSKTSSDYSFLKKMDPQYAIISASVSNRYHHPHKETLTSLEQLKILHFQTGISGTIQVTFQKDSYHIHPFFDTIIQGA